MKKLLLLLLLTGAGARPVLAQRHIQHISTLSAQVGRSEQGHYYELGYSTFLTNRTSLRLGGLYEKGSLGEMGHYSSYGGRVFIAPQLLHLGEFAYVHLLLGGAGNYELGGEQPATDGLSTERRKRFTFGPRPEPKQTSSSAIGYQSWPRPPRATCFITRLLTAGRATPG